MDQKNGESANAMKASNGLPCRPANGTQESSSADVPYLKSSKASKGHKSSNSQSNVTPVSRAQMESKRASSNPKSGGGKNVHSSEEAGSSPISLPDFVLKRNELFEELKKKSDAELLQKERPEINVVLDLGLDKDGKPRPLLPVAAKAWESTPGSFLRHVDKDVSADVVIAKVDGKVLWDLDRPLEYGCRVSYLPFTSAEGRNVFWHSSAHVLGEAAECHYNCLLSHGPPVEQGFFYDMAIADGYVFS